MGGLGQEERETPEANPFSFFSISFQKHRRSLSVRNSVLGERQGVGSGHTDESDPAPLSVPVRKPLIHSLALEEQRRLRNATKGECFPVLP